MDPALQELIRPSHDATEVVEALIRLAPGAAAPRSIRIVTRFGDIATCRVRRSDIKRLYGRWPIDSFKAARSSSTERVRVDQKPIFKASDRRWYPGMPTGRGVMLGVIDWGIDFDHTNFKKTDGSTRLKAIWDQRAQSAYPPIQFDYGAIFDQKKINKALQSSSPYRYLNYHPASADPRGIGAHGTHVMDIAAGSGAIGPVGMAPEADLAFVHLASKKGDPRHNLGDSVRILEAIDFLDKLAGRQPLVINMSVGRHGGPHDGSTLVEQGIDAFLRSKPDRFIVQSTGNYFKTRTHASGMLASGERQVLRLNIGPHDYTTNEIEVWYEGEDNISAKIRHKETGINARVGQNSNHIFRSDGEVIGRLYHRTKEPNNGRNHINIFLFANAPVGRWELHLHAHSIRSSGIFHTWIERDGACKDCQTRFYKRDADPYTTTGTICNGVENIVVGAFDPKKNKVAPFSSRGPTVDGRIKPDFLAPGVQVLAAKSSPPTASSSTYSLTRMSGTSMAAPYVAGMVAGIRELNGPLWAYEARNILY
ncbi:MAG: S8 family serine peptidase [Bacteroidia bacterium]